MKNKYECKICNYDTVRLFNYDKHLLTEKHKKLEIKGTTILPNIVDSNGSDYQKNDIKCEFCKKKISHRNHVKRHQKTCKEKNTYDIEQQTKVQEVTKTNIETKLKQEKEELERKLECKNKENEQLLQLYEDIKDEYIEYLKYVSKESLDKIGTNNGNNVSCNIYYIMNNCKDAYDYEELMDPKLTQIEIEDLQNSSTSVGCYNILNNRCIKDIELHKRPFHLLDSSRKKYYVKSNGAWKVDTKGEDIINGLAKKVHDVYLSNNINDSVNSVNIIISGNKKFKEFISSKHKILEYINEHVSLKNNMKNLLTFQK